MNRKDGKPKIKSFTICNKCNDTVSNFAYNRHYKTCLGVNKNLREEKKIFGFDEANISKIDENNYLCLDCNKQYSKAGIGTHYWRNHTEVGKNFTANNDVLHSKPAWNKGLTAETDERVKLYVEKATFSLRKGYSTGKITPSKGGFAKWYNYKNIKVIGTYEFRMCFILDKWKELGKIKNWEYTNDRVQYKDIEGVDRTYILDFKITNNDDSFYYLETKGRQRENDELKWQAVFNKGFDLKIWFKKQIKEEEKILNII